MGLVANMRQSCNDAYIRRCAAEETSKKLVSFLAKAPRYVRPDISVVNHYNYGAGSDGVFISVSLKSREITSVAMLSNASANKNVFYLSGVVYAIDCFAREVQGFSLEDGVGICACLTLFNSAELLVQPLLSGELRRHWARRHEYVAGVCGLIVSLVCERIGGTCRAKHTRRCQPFKGGMVIPGYHDNDSRGMDSKRHTKMIEVATKMCENSQVAATWDGDLAKRYDEAVSTIQKCLRTTNKKEINLSTQHFVHVLAMCGFLKPVGIIRFATISTSNSNSNKLHEYLRNGSRERVRVHQIQAEKDLSNILEMDVTSSIVENILCESSRANPGTDCLYPGQFFLELNHNVITGRYYQTCLTPEWNGSCFSTTHACEYEGVPVSDWNGRHNLVGGVLVLRKGTGEGQGSDVQIRLTRNNIGPYTMLKIKELMCSPHLRTESGTEYNNRIRKAIAMLPIVSQIVNACTEDGVPPGKKWRATPWEEKVHRWNSVEDPRLKSALARHATPRATPPAADELNDLMTGPLLPLDTDTQPAAYTVAPFASLPLGSLPLAGDKQPAQYTDTLPAVAAALKKAKPSSVAAVTAVVTPTKTEPAKQTAQLGRRQTPSRWSTEASPLSKRKRLYSTAMEDRKLPAWEDRKLPARPGEDRKLPARPGPDSIYNIETGNWESPESQRNMMAPNASRTNMTPAHDASDGEIFRDSNGVERRLDWTAQNMERIARQDWCGPENNQHTRITTFPNQASLAMISGCSFKGIEGARDLITHVHGPFQTIPEKLLPNLFDEARNAVNSLRFKSNRPLLKGNFETVDFTYKRFHGDQGEAYYTCACTKLPGLDIEVYFSFGRCLLCDRIATCLQGRRLPHGENFLWVFGTRNLARQYLLTCVMLTTGTSQHYIDLHRRARRDYKRCLTLANYTTDPKHNKKDESTRFVFAYAPEAGKEPPFFYVIGHREKVHDFAIAIPSLTFQQKFRAKKTTKRDAKGDAIYIRPFYSQQCLFTS